MKKNHKDDLRRITTEERAERLLVQIFVAPNGTARGDIRKALSDHVKAAHRRHARKNICTPRKAKPL